ncbi:MAG: hypothetical protein U0414_19890 [Polyangiaceae bacterium]
MRTPATVCSIAMMLAAPSVAVADDAASAELPVALVERPMTSPQRALTFEAGLSIAMIPFVEPAQPFGSAAIGGRYGLTDDVTLTATPLSMEGQYGVEFGRFAVGLLDRVQHGERAELGAGVELVVDPERGEVVLQPRIPLSLRFGAIARVDLGAQMAIRVGDVGFPTSLAAIDPLGVRLLPGIPLDATVQFAPFLFAGIQTGFGIRDLSKAAEHEFAKLGFTAGGTVPVHGAPVLDVIGRFEFPELLSSDPLVDGWLPQLWQAMLTLQAHVRI